MNRQFTLLVVDDEELMREVIVFDLERKGFRVLEAENGAKAFQLIEENTIDLVISDIRMPGGDGIELLKAVRKRNPKVPPVILITGFSDISEAECIQKGASRVFSKPFERAQLLTEINKALGIK